ncbi:Uma2 family endonuclease [Oscillochloris sp. ZM17-4]|uniref:Uma2 family endonuclease n=1 Tax=Oscillochloris sp. ZM17-4 TaxID=2866714 RepID=UPI001C72FF4F|nr:Uma2 family endonuclease [Oscillochloris sp. ZM17-4]MBX0330145.1 Uma2 family endonuclease [Oscillochloris sp. ZM17-4]
MSAGIKRGKPLYILYPESDGQPIAENTRQFRWIVTIAGGLEAIFADQDDVFVAGNLLWYPVEGRPDIRVAPDALVAFGRPKGDRGSYMQWLEAGVAPQVVFEVLSPGNRHREMVRKFRFYEEYGVEEYYLYDPEANELEGWLRTGDELLEIVQIDGWVSPRLGLRFVIGVEELEIYRPNGRRLPTYEDVLLGRDGLAKKADAAQQWAEAAQQRAEAAERQASTAIQRMQQALQQAEAAQRRAEAVDREIVVAQRQAEVAQRQAEAAQRQAEAAQRQAEDERARAERLGERLRHLGESPDA